jgi:hypothetical protein
MIAAPSFPGEVSCAQDQRLRERCQEKTSTLHIPRPFGLEEFRAGLERQRGRALHLMATHMKTGAPCGLWIAMAETDYIFYEANTTPLHRLHIIFHEAGHMIFNHHGGPPDVGEIVSLLLPALDPELVRSALDRTTYTDAEDQEAEMFATLLLEQLALAPEAMPPLPPR